MRFAETVFPNGNIDTASTGVFATTVEQVDRYICKGEGEESWSLERFCFSQEMQNIYSKFFWGFPFDRFSFVGVTENYESDLQYFARVVLNSELPLSNVNVNPRKTVGRYIEDEQLRSNLERFHNKDMQLYHSSLVVSNNRI